MRVRGGVFGGVRRAAQGKTRRKEALYKVQSGACQVACAGGNGRMFLRTRVNDVRKQFRVSIGKIEVALTYNYRTNPASFTCMHITPS